MRRCVVALFAGFLLVHMVVDNYVQQYGDRRDPSPVSRASSAWGRATGTVQGWSLFTPPMARRGGFPAVEIIFSDGSGELVASDNEPARRDDFVRVGRLRLRRLEDYIVLEGSDLVGTREEAMLRAYVRHRVEHWRARHPSDARTPVRGILSSRTYEYTEPGTADTPAGAPEIKVLFICDLRGERP